MTMSADLLSDRMECDHVIQVHEDGTVTDSSLYAPETIWDGWGRGVHVEPGLGWTPLTGYSRQEGYSGPVMHASEYIGADMADEILSTPGYWVWTVVNELAEDLDEPDACEPAGWMVCYREV